MHGQVIGKKKMVVAAATWIKMNGAQRSHCTFSFFRVGGSRISGDGPNLGRDLNIKMGFEILLSDPSTSGRNAVLRPKSINLFLMGADDDLRSSY